MKKILFLSLSALCAMSISACKQEQPETPSSSFTIVAQTEKFADSESKTTLDGYDVKWVNGDKISVAENSSSATQWTTGKTFTYKDGVFTSTSTIADGTYDFKAIYGSEDQLDGNKSTATTYTLATTQEQDCSDPKAHLAKYDAMAGKFSATTPMTGTSATLKMNHLFTLMEVDIKNTLGKNLTINTFSITATSNIAGVYTVDYSGTSAVATYKEDGKTTITVNVKNGVLNNGESLPVYFIMAPLSKYSGDITLTATDTDGNKYSSAKILSSQTFAAGSWNKTTFTLKYADETTLAELTAMATSSAQTKTIKVRDVVVTCVSGKYAHLEDATAAVLVYKTNHGLTVGQKITGSITVKFILYDGYTTYKGPGYTEVTSIDISKATVTKTTELPLKEVTVSQLNSNFGNYWMRRLKFKDVSVTTGISSSVQNGKITQNSESVIIFNKNKSAEIESGLTGDLIAYPAIYRGQYQVLVYTTDQFTESTGPVEDDAFTKITVPGVYDITNISAPSSIYTIKTDDQSAYATSSSSICFRIQNLSDGTMYGALVSSAKVKSGSSYSSTILTISGTSATSASATLYVSKSTSTMIWLKDKTANKGYIFNIL